MAVVSGKDGNVQTNGSDVTDVVSWSLTYDANLHSYVTSDTSGWEDTLAGAKKWSGSFDVLNGDGKVGTLQSGDSVSLKLEVVEGGKYYEGTAIIGAITSNVNIGTQEPIAVNVSFTGSGALTLPT